MHPALRELVARVCCSRTQVGAAFNANFNNVNTVTLVASQWLPVDFSTPTPRVLGCGAKMTTVNACGLPNIVFDSSNAPCFACP